MLQASCAYGPRCRYLHIPTIPPPLQAGAFGGGSVRGLGGDRYRYKMKMCKHLETGQCPFGDKCRFAHSDEEIRKSIVNNIISQNPRYKTTFCTFQDGSCPKGEKCHFAHSSQKLRVASQHHRTVN